MTDNPSELLSIYRVKPGLLEPQPLSPTPHTREDGPDRLAFVYSDPCPLVFLEDILMLDLDLE